MEWGHFRQKSGIAVFRGMDILEKMSADDVSPFYRQLPRVGVRFPTWITFQRAVFDGLIEFMQAHDPWVLEAPMDTSNELPPTVIDASWRGEGLIVFRYTQEEAEAWKAAGIPVVNLSSERIDGPFPSIVPDNVQGGAEAARHLLSLGLKDFAFVGREVPFIDDGLTGLNVARRYSLEREEGFRHIMAVAGHEPLSFHLRTETSSSEVWRELQGLYADLLERLPRPCGVFAADDLIAHGLLQAAHRSGVRVPQELAIIGFNDQSHFCQAATPPLSSVTYPGRAIGRLAAETLYQMMNGGGEPERMIRRVAVTGVTIRESTNVLAIRDPLVAGAVRLIRKQAATSAPRVGEIAEVLGVSVSLLRQRFLNATGISPKEEVDRARLDIIRHWLATSELGLSEIAAKTGFADAGELRRFFKRGSGETPQAFRSGREGDDD